MKKFAAEKSPAYDSFKPVSTLFPRRLSNHKLGRENHLGGVPPAHQGVIKRGQFFNEIGWRVKEGWKLLGWATPPYPRGDSNAIVFEKVTPFEGETDDFHESLEPGIYWCHGNEATMKFYNL